MRDMVRDARYGDVVSHRENDCLFCFDLYSKQTYHEEGDPHKNNDERRQGADVHPRGSPDRAGGRSSRGIEGQHAADHRPIHGDSRATGTVQGTGT